MGAEFAVAADLGLRAEQSCSGTKLRPFSLHLSCEQGEFMINSVLSSVQFLGAENINF